MKRFIRMGFCVVFVAGLIAALFACVRSDRQEDDRTQTETSVVTATATPLVSDDDAFSAAEDMVKEMTLPEKIGQMFLVDLLQLDARPSLDGSAKEVTPTMVDSLQRYNIGGVYLTTQNIQDKEQTTRLIQDLQAGAVTGGALYVAVEEDGGGEHSLSSKVKDLAEIGYVTPQEMGRDMTSQQLCEAGKTIAGKLADLGINLNLAPVADIESADNPEYGKRCLGTDADTVASVLDEYVSGMRAGGLAVTLRNFPGIGNVSGDTTETILENQDSLMTLRDQNFTTYESGIEAGADCIMVSNVAVPKVTGNKTPSFMSQEVVTELLREEIGFDGVILTSPLDDNVIRNNYTYDYVVVEAVKAGCDMIVLPGNFKECYQALLDAVEEGKIDEKVINTSVRRILQNKIQRGMIVLE